jgi:3-phenylpropionate/trans-cinnamate dioxygenase ferredoxin component
VSDFVRVCAFDELAEQEPRRVVVDDVPISVVRVDEEVFAVYDVCSHEEVSLSEGDVDDYTIECWLHGSRFDLRTGKPTGLPATKPIPVYPVKVQGDDVFVAVEES